MNRYLKAEELPQWDAIAVTLEIEDNSSATYYIDRQDLKPGIDLISNADSDNSGWSRWGSLVVEEILPDGVMTSLGELTPGSNLHKVYRNVYPYCDGYLTAVLVSMTYEVTVDDPEDGTSYTAYIPRLRYKSDSNKLEPLITMAKEFFPQAKGYIKYLESLRPNPTNNPIKWSVCVYKDNTCKLSVQSGLYPKVFDFPDKVKENDAMHQVVDIDGGGTRRSGELQTLSFPNGVKRIEGFNGCVHLTSVTLPPTLVELRYRAFAECVNLSEIEIPESVTHIGVEAFYGTNISEVLLPKNLVDLRHSAFSYTPLRSISIPEKVDKIWDSCLMDCPELEEVALPEGMTVIEEKAFKNCTNLTRINIPDGMRYIGEEAFAGCTSLKEISLPKHVLLHPDAFKDCPCAVTYRDSAEIPSWDKVEVVHRTWYYDKTKNDFEYSKTYKQISDDPKHNEICGDICGFCSVTIEGFNEKFVRLEIMGWKHVLMAGESMQITPNMSLEEIITVM